MNIFFRIETKNKTNLQMPSLEYCYNVNNFKMHFNHSPNYGHRFHYSQKTKSCTARTVPLFYEYNNQ